MKTYFYALQAFVSLLVVAPAALAGGGGGPFRPYPESNLVQICTPLNQNSPIQGLKIVTAPHLSSSFQVAYTGGEVSVTTKFLGSSYGRVLNQSKTLELEMNLFDLSDDGSERLFNVKIEPLNGEFDAITGQVSCVKVN